MVHYKEKEKNKNKNKNKKYVFIKKLQRRQPHRVTRGDEEEDDCYCTLSHGRWDRTTALCAAKETRGQDDCFDERMTALTRG